MDEFDVPIIETEKILTGEFFFNIALHVTILFTILSLFFIFYIRNVTTNAINHEFNEIINHTFKSINKNDINQIYHNFESGISDNINNINAAQNILNLPQNILNQSNQPDLNKPNMINDIFSQIKNNFSLDYYKKIFSEDDLARQQINKNLINEIIHVNVFIYILLVLFTLVLLKTQNLKLGEIGPVVGENLLTFTMVGIVEIVFFMNIASKYIPAPPSLIYTSLIDGIKANFSI
jgi:hypothetical protein